MAGSLPPGLQATPSSIVVLFTGSERGMGVWHKTNLRFWLRPVPEFCGLKSGKVHSGFSHLLEEIWPSIMRALDHDGHNWITESTVVWLVGHSLGGALATLAAPAISSLAKRTPAVFVSTVGSPRLFDSQAAEQYELCQSITVRRYVGGLDSVPQCPMKMLGFQHVGTAAALPQNEGKWLEWLNMSHHELESYKRAFDKLLGE